MTAFLWTNAVLYVLFAAWCTLAPDRTAAALGFGLTDASARSEWITVYGGLEFGVALFFGWTARQAEFRPAGVMFGRCLYSALVVFRVGTLVTGEGVGAVIYGASALELAMAAWAWTLDARPRPTA